jgi:hypothetical protein
MQLGFTTPKESQVPLLLNALSPNGGTAMKDSIVEGIGRLIKIA